MERWRVIFGGRRSASFNMAADDFLLSAADSGHSAPVIRIYGWEEPSITIGYHQRLDRAVDVSRLGRTPVVRRTTGGRALLHDDGELTYAVAGNYVRNPRLGGHLHESYRIIAEGIVRFYRLVGWQVSVSRRDNPVSLARPVQVQKGCFASVSQYEIIYRGQKVAAGSQRRTASALMQHGAVKIGLPTRHPAIDDLSQSVTGHDIQPMPGAAGELAVRLAAAFAEEFGVALADRPFTARERAAIEGWAHRFGNLNSGQ